jgi:glycosyltransferase involved in cell wall biosynthesis
MDLSNWAVVGFKDDTGIGRMCQDIQNVLGVRKHLVAPSERMKTKEIFQPQEYLMSEKQDIDTLILQMKTLDGIICIERLHWNPLLITAAQKLGLKIVCVPMWEWFRGTDTEWNIVDRFLCPNQKSLEVLHSYGFSNAHKVNWALNISSLPIRKINGAAQTFFHNAGLVDHDDRKGTNIVVEAFTKIKNPDLRLIIRMQKKKPLPKLDERIDVRVCNLQNPSELYLEGDAAIQPSMMEGLGFMVLEAVCCGLPVITTNAPPMSEYVCNHLMRARKQIFKRKSFAYKSAAIKHSHLTPPSISSLVNRIEWCSRNDLTNISNENRLFGEKRFNKESLKKEWIAALSF